MKQRTISFSPPDITELEIAEVIEALRSGWITTGPRTKLLERRLAAYIETGNNDIKRYILNHIRCLLEFGKEVIIDVKAFINVLNPEFQN